MKEVGSSGASEGVIQTTERSFLLSGVVLGNAKPVDWLEWGEGRDGELRKLEKGLGSKPQHVRGCAWSPRKYQKIL